MAWMWLPVLNSEEWRWQIEDRGSHVLQLWLPKDTKDISRPEQWCKEFRVSRPLVIRVEWNHFILHGFLISWRETYINVGPNVQKANMSQHNHSTTLRLVQHCFIYRSLTESMIEVLRWIFDLLKERESSLDIWISLLLTPCCRRRHSPVTACFLRTVHHQKCLPI